jgi:hypothetical protein
MGVDIVGPDVQPPSTTELTAGPKGPDNPADRLMVMESDVTPGTEEAPLAVPPTNPTTIAIIAEQMPVIVTDRSLIRFTDSPFSLFTACLLLRQR